MDEKHKKLTLQLEEEEQRRDQIFAEFKVNTENFHNSWSVFSKYITYIRTIIQTPTRLQLLVKKFTDNHKDELESLNSKIEEVLDSVGITIQEKLLETNSGMVLF